MAYWKSARFALCVARRIARGNRSVRQTLAPPQQTAIATKEGVLWPRDGAGRGAILQGSRPD